MSALQIASILFAVGGLFDALIGALTPLVTRMRPLPVDAFLQNAQADRVLFGRSARALLSEDAALAMLYRTTFDLIGALLLVFGLLQAGVAWFALREGHAWALWLLVAVDLLFIAGWGLVYSQYFQRGMGLGAIGVPPNLLVPLVLLIPATLLAIVGLYQPNT
ncbi:MAG TPA: hypothetical protein VGK28_01245 [Candidatus Dormibacteraeota bacterium]